MPSCFAAHREWCAENDEMDEMVFASSLTRGFAENDEMVCRQWGIDEISNITAKPAGCASILTLYQMRIWRC
jgi:hypothetical protein